MSPCGGGRQWDEARPEQRNPVPSFQRGGGNGGGRCVSNNCTVKQVTALSCQRPYEGDKCVIKQMVRQNNYNSDGRLTMVNAQVLPAPRPEYYYHDSGRDTNVDLRMGRWNMINPDMIFQFCGDLISTCSSKGMAFNPYPLLPINTSHPDQIERALLDVHSQSTAKLASSMGQSDKRLQLLIIILPNVVYGSYGLIKRVCETELGIVSQCCQPHKAQKLIKQYLENVSLKINMKMVASMNWPEVTKYRGLGNIKMERRSNILPGTVVDTEICHPTEFDFYLNNHVGFQCVQGTSTPSHYDEINFFADQLQMLTNNFSYKYKGLLLYFSHFEDSRVNDVGLSLTYSFQLRILAIAVSVDEMIANNNKELRLNSPESIKKRRSGHCLIGRPANQCLLLPLHILQYIRERARHHTTMYYTYIR